MSDVYAYLHLRGAGRDTAALEARLEASARPAWEDAGVAVWGVWQGLFGVASNELVVMVSGTADTPVAAFSKPLGDLEIRNQLRLVPTVRPTGRAPCTLPGLYVFRFFRVLNADVAAFAQLSEKAWTTFENAEAYRAQPQGLFRQQDVNADKEAEQGTMLLVTWYDGLESWQTSRLPAPAARENFSRRRALTLDTMALAVRLKEA